MDEITVLFFQLLRVALGNDRELLRAPSQQEWHHIFEAAKRQALLGIAFSGIEKLPKQQLPDKTLLLQWYSIVLRIEEQNKKMNKNSVFVSKQFLKDGYRGCILKGQGNAILYQQPHRRQSGDIDIWLDGNRTDLLNYTLSHFPNAKFKFQHVDFPAMKDVEIELHFFPMYMQNPIGNWHLQKFFRNHKEEVFNHLVSLPEHAGQISVPTARFNAVYQLTHLFIHFIIEGIGLRQFVDYYHVLEQLSDEDKPDVIATLKKINLYKFSTAVMYVEQNVLGLREQHLITPPDAKRGKQLLNEILQGGNFGRYETRYWKKNGGFIDKQWKKIVRNAHFLFNYPGEVCFEPLFRLYHAAWREYMRVFVLKKRKK